MHTLRAMRSEVPLPSDDATRSTEARLMAAIRQDRPRHGLTRRTRFAWGAALASGLAAALTVGVLVLPGEKPGGSDRGSDRGATIDGRTPAAPLKLTSAVEVLDLAATATRNEPELAPRSDQAIMIKSVAMYEASMVSGGRWLYSNERTVWWPADPARDGALERTWGEPKAFPGEPIPPMAYNQVGKTEQNVLKVCPGSSEYTRSDFPYVSKLPTTPAAMLTYLRNSPGGKNSADARTFGAAGDLIREAYLPPAQRAAVYRALALIPGLQFIDGAADAAGRKGVAVAFTDTGRGVRKELLFDPASFRYLGEREFVTDAAKAKTPVGTQTALTALLSAEVVDTVPTIAPGPKGEQTCG
jgi:hypothetical protein